jgi:hypothetical protein
VYSFGVLLFEMLTGTIPFQADHVMGMMYAIVNSEPSPIRGKRGEISPGLERIVMKCMAREKNSRYAGMRAIINDLAALRGGRETILSPTTGTDVAGGPKRRGRGLANVVRSRKGVLWGLLAVAVVAVSILFLVQPGGGPVVGSLTIASDPPGSTVWINGKEVGLTPLERYPVSSGRLALRLLRSSYHAVDTSVDVIADQRLQMRILLRPIETARDTSRTVPIADLTPPGSRRGTPSADSALQAAPTVMGSVDALATSLVRQLARKTGTVRGAVAVRPFTFQNTQFGSAFSRYFKSLIEHRASALTQWTVLASEDGSGQAVRASEELPAFEITGTYWPQPGRVRFFALLQDTKTREISGRAEAAVLRKGVLSLETRWTPENMTQALENARALGKTEAESGDLGLELLTNKGVENLVFTEGDTLKTYVRVNKPCTVRVFYHSADGTRYALTGPGDLAIGPNQINTPVMIDVAECAPPFGAEVLQAFATTDRFEPIQTRHVEGGYYVLEDKLEKAMIATRGIRKLGSVSPIAERRVVITTIAKDLHR